MISVADGSDAEGSVQALMVWKEKNGGLSYVAKFPLSCLRSITYHRAGSEGSMAEILSRILRFRTMLRPPMEIWLFQMQRNKECTYAAMSVNFARMVVSPVVADVQYTRYVGYIPTTSNL